MADAVSATRAAAIAPHAAGRVYNVGGGSRVTLMDAIAKLEGIAGRPISINRQPPQPGDVRDTGGHTSRAARDFGFKPETPFSTGLEHQFEWVRDGHERMRPALPA